jgi:penicillin-binding protein 1A
MYETFHKPLVTPSSSQMKILRFLLTIFSGLLTVAVIAVAVAYFYIVPQLPSIEALRDVRLQVPLRIYSADGLLLAEFGEMRRIPVSYSQVPKPMINAFLAAEDDRFFQHPGVDYQGLLRATFELVRTGEKRQGGSTITMQVARNFFLSSEKTYLRKLTEIFLALKIERKLNKEEILELYLNKIYLGHRSYGIGAAAEVYYGSHLDELSIAKMAMIAGLPKAPSRVNPITDPEAATARRNYVLARMHQLGYLDDAGYQAAVSEVDTASLHAAAAELDAPYLAEMVRAEMVKRFGNEAYTGGYRVVTTIDSRLQRAATSALRETLVNYDKRHGFRGPEHHFDLSKPIDIGSRADLLQEFSVYGDLYPALVTKVDKTGIEVILIDSQRATVEWPGISWARPYIDSARTGNPPKQASDVVKIGDVIRVRRDNEKNWQLAQIPEVEGALVSMRTQDGSILALTGGFDFQRSKFNRVTQAYRQPGSSFKPFVYSAALEHGFTAASVLNDAPVVFDDPTLEQAWRPENYSGRFYGPTRLREALVRSRNLVSVRLLQAIGIDYAVEYVQRFGFDPQKLPRDLSLALGSGTVTPIGINAAYAVFANGGFRVEPYFVRQISGAGGKLVYQANAPVHCSDCEESSTTPLLAETTANLSPNLDTVADVGIPRMRSADRVITPQNAWLITSMLQDAINRGTGRRARQLQRSDLAGKTGTTNDQRDAWFCGFSHDLVTTAWTGFDALQPLGPSETGAHAALPMWMDFMKVALEGVPEKRLDTPPGLVTVRIDPATGLLASSRQHNAVFETFREGHTPTETSRTISATDETSHSNTPEQLF